MASIFTDEDYLALVSSVKSFRVNVENKRDGLKEVLEDEPELKDELMPVIKTYEAILTDLTVVERRIKKV